MNDVIVSLEQACAVGSAKEGLPFELYSSLRLVLLVPVVRLQAEPLLSLDTTRYLRPVI